MPANGAFSASSIFIASMTPSASPSSTVVPEDTCTASTVPGMGAVTVPDTAGLALPGPKASGLANAYVCPR